MEDSALHSPVSGRGAAREALPAPIALRQLWPWLLFAVALFAILYLIAADQGAVSLVPGSYVHEFVHDGRHLLGFPCH
jgi:cobalt transporter subunit CbtB